tara:strand:+ start:87155 stop:88090 length:936 start_codon:yes stop_codon:yes gene_type:complete
VAQSITIKVISDACGVLPQTLRAWEKRYGAFNPKRDHSGQRIYGHEDLKRSMAIASLIKRGFTISQIACKSLEELQRLLDETQVIVDENPFLKLGGEESERNRILELISEFKFDEFVEEFNRLRTLMSIKDFIFDLSIPIMREVGQRVVDNRFSITQEHIVSSIIRGQLNELKSPVDLFVKSKGSFHRYALATPEGNHHELSIVIADLICGINRRHTTYLGAAHPAKSLAMAVTALKCDRIVLGTVHSELWDYEKEMIPYLKKMDEGLGIDVEVIIGGGWNLNFPKMRRIKKVHFLESFELFDKKLMQSIL